MLKCIIPNEPCALCRALQVEVSIEHAARRRRGCAPALLEGSDFPVQQKKQKVQKTSVGKEEDPTSLPVTRFTSSRTSHLTPHLQRFGLPPNLVAASGNLPPVTFFSLTPDTSQLAPHSSHLTHRTSLLAPHSSHLTSGVPPTSCATAASLPRSFRTVFVDTVFL